MVHWGSGDCVPPLPLDGTDADMRAHLIEWAGVVGLSSIKEDNVEEWMWRLTFLRETLDHGAARLTYWDGTGRARKERHEYITIPILRRWVGLWTNWSNVKRSEWVKLRMERLTQVCDGKVRRELEKEQESKAKATKKKRRVKA